MYNGVGLQTARGSGTSGYVQRNLSHVLPGQRPQLQDYGKILQQLKVSHNDHYYCKGTYFTVIWIRTCLNPCPSRLTKN